MRAMDQAGATAVIDTERYPVFDPDTGRWREVVEGTRRELAEVGCSVLSGFIRSACYDTLREEGERVAPLAYYQAETVNVYNIDVRTPLPPGHPGRLEMQRGNAFVARDLIGATALIHQLYTDEHFRHFVAGCFGLGQLYELADPLSGLVLNVIKPGLEHPWHFDTNEYTVSLLTQASTAGGIFEYCPNIRSAESENPDDVLAVLEGRGERLIRQLTLHPGDLQLFKGRYALHRVSPVAGTTARHTAIFAYSERAGVIGSPARTQQLFGRVSPEHREEAGRVRVDQLLD
jgi:hypothetical protein